MRAGGKKAYRYLLRRHVLPELGHCRLVDISFNQIQTFVGKLLDAGYAVQSVAHVRQVTNSVFKHAVRTGHFAGTLPTTGIRLPALVRTRERHSLTIEQARSVLAELKSPYREMALVSMTTSMNLAELCALRWKRVNLTNDPLTCDGDVIPPNALAVHESFYEGAFGPPKTPSRRRLIPLPEASVEALKSIRKSTRFSGPDDIVFATRNGSPKLASNLRWRTIKPVGNKLGMPWLNWHAFRNTFATIGEQLNIALSDRQASLGHGSVWMSMEYTVADIERRRAGSELIAAKIA